MMLLGYVDRTSVRPGETIDFKVSAKPESKLAVQMLRLRCCLDDRSGPGWKVETLPGEGPHTCRGERQRLDPGSYGVTASIPSEERVGELTVAVWVYPTLFAGEPHSPDRRWTYDLSSVNTIGVGAQQGIVCRPPSGGGAGYALYLDQAGRPVFRIVHDGSNYEVRCASSLPRRTWSLLVARASTEHRRLTLDQISRGPWARREVASAADRLPAQSPYEFRDQQVVLAAMTPGTPHAESAPAGLFSGKLDSPTIWHQYLSDSHVRQLIHGESPRSVGPEALWSAWNLSEWPDTDRFADTAPAGRHGLLVHQPTRAVTGFNWTGNTHDFRHAPEEYGAIHFHPDDMSDAGWRTTFGWSVPAETPSGVYAAEVTLDSDRELLWFVVLPTSGPPRKSVVVILPTLTYLAYANTQLPYPDIADRPTGYIRETDHRRRYIDEHPELGRSLYDLHSDGSGVCYVSRLRPMPDNRPDFVTDYLQAGRHLAADLYLIDWLTEVGVDFDVVTDEDLHRQGDGLLAGYRIAITGSHPEYTTKPMLDALTAFGQDGGNLMYLGGNGFWCVASLGGEDLHVMECRRGMAGSTIWRSEPGEVHHSTTGEPGGMWRFHGRSPNTLTGVGCAAAGSGAAAKGYHRQPDSFRPECAFVFEGIEDDEMIGDFGFASGGAAGDEIDRVDPINGSPVETLILATASGFSDDYQVLVEDILQMEPETGGTQHPHVRSDMALVLRGDRGSVFSVGSMTWTASLAHNHYQNNVATITLNVLRRFIADGPPATQQVGRPIGRKR